MLTISGSIVLGVVSGIITSFILWTVISIFRKILLPWYQGVIYQGLSIEGTWIGFYEDSKFNESDPDFSIDIRQKGANVRGVINRHKVAGGGREIKAFNFSGIFREANLVITYQPVDGTRLGLGSYVMLLSDDGRRFEGKILFVPANHRRGNVADRPLYWVRSSR
jgi:hypothetical protein